MDFEDKKENIQPLRAGRNVEHLEHAFESTESWEENRKLHEEEIEKYVGDDPLQLWYDYMSWMEQTNVSSGKPMILEDAVRRCVQKFENDPRYMQDHRFIKLCIKYIDTQPSPVELYNELYNRGVGTLCSELYIAWAYYYDAVDNFAKTEEVFQKGLRAGAEPKVDLEQAHTTFGFSMSQRMLYKDECSQKKFQTSLDERRNALTSLRASRKKNVGSIRTGLAVKSYRPGVVNQENMPINGPARNAAGNAIVFSDEPGTSGEPSSIVRPFSSVHNEAENIIGSARLIKSQGSQKKSVLFPSHHAPSFDIPVDEEQLLPLPVLVDNSARGIQLPARFCRKNKPQTPFEVSICMGDPKERAIPMYDKIRLYCRANGQRGVGEKTEYSPEELRAFCYFNRKGIDNHFTQVHARTWGNGYDVGIRLHPLHVPECKSKEPMGQCKNISPLEEPNMIFHTNIREMYANPADEKSMEELLMVKWQEGKIKRCVDRRYQDDIDPVDMDETRVEPQRISMGGARFSMAPSMGVEGGTGSQAQMRQRRSIFPIGGPTVALIAEETEEELRNRSTAQAERSIEKMSQPPQRPAPEQADLQADGNDDVASRKRLSDDVLAQATSKREDTRPTPSKSVLDCGNQRKEENTDDISPPPPVIPEKVQIFVDDSDEHDEREEHQFPKPPTVAGGDQPYYPNDSCSTQMFNMFVKNISTPVGPVRKQQSVPVSAASTGMAKRLVVFADEDDAEDDGAGPRGRKSETRATPLRDIADSQKQYPPCRPPSEAVSVPTTEAKVNDENAVPTVDSCTPPSTSTSTSSACNSTQSHKQLSTIMERTETSTTSASAVTGATKSSVDSQPLSPETNVTTAGEEFHLPVPKLSTVVAPKESFFKLPLPSDEPKGFGIHIDSTETMANIPLLLKRDLPPVQTDDKENECVLRAATTVSSTSTSAKTSPAGIFHLPDEPTYTGMAGGQRNLSHMVQRELDANSIASFRMTTERTNTVPLQMVKPQYTIPEVDSNAVAPSCAPLGGSSVASDGTTMVAASLSDLIGNVTQTEQLQANTPNLTKKKHYSLLEQLDATFSPKVGGAGGGGGGEAVEALAGGTVRRGSTEDTKSKDSSFNLIDLVKPPQTTPSSVGFTQELPALEQLAVPFDELSLLPQIKMEPSLHLDLTEDTEPVGGRPLPPLAIANAMAHHRVSPFQDAYDGDASIYHPRPTIPQEDEERWEEIDEQFDPQVDNEYRRKPPADMECTIQHINACVAADDVDPFDKQLLDAFLERLDFMNYIAELPNCTLMNKVQPLKKGARLALTDGGDAYEVQQKIGKGAYGTVFCGFHVSTGQKVALKQERPANLWEYYICLEIRSRLTNPEILPGFMSIDHAFVGNNASIFVSTYSRYGNILDVCNLVNKVTNRHVDEFIAMIISAQILSIVDHLHSCQIIHADIKPDNFLFMSPINLDAKLPCVQLIDFGESIDMQLFERDVTFHRVITTDGFTCIEMREGRPWTYQPDLFGVAATSHAMLFGKYMQVQKDIVNWGIKTPMPRYFKKAVWENYFTALLNIRDCDHLPNLQNLRTAFLEEISLHEKYIRSKVADFNQVLTACK
uniref:Mitotic checkpoint serine/threonine-protein kinase BUB1 n=1 Tax=Anopheles atroparvus TaxID=41427 RepID=A0AAG5CUH3_ANOAO